MIIMDEKYAAASEATRQWAERLIRRRFCDLYGKNGDRAVTEMQRRMLANVRSDSRAPPGDHRLNPKSTLDTDETNV